jgi:hypothetical protein
MEIYLCLIVLFFVGTNAGESRVYNNPLNNKAVDLFLLVDENNSHLDQMQLGLIKIALNAIATELQPAGTSPYFSVIFYGATPTIHTVVPFMTGSATVVKLNLDLKQYTTGHSIPSTLISALDSVDKTCQSNCRSNVPRVTIIFTSYPDSSSESRIRQLENNRGMIVIVVGIGYLVNSATLNSLASYPSKIYALPFVSLFELIVSAPFVASVISNVPRLLSIGSTLNVSRTTSGVYYMVQFNTFGYIRSNDTVITFTLNCNDCLVYGSLSEPNPTSVNSLQNVDRQYFYASGYTYTVFYFRIPKNANRFFLSFVRNAMSSLTGIFNVFNMPQIMNFSN